VSFSLMCLLHEPLLMVFGIMQLVTLEVLVAKTVSRSMYMLLLVLNKEMIVGSSLRSFDVEN
jgi:hypothetical protein